MQTLIKVTTLNCKVFKLTVEDGKEGKKKKNK